MARGLTSGAAEEELVRLGLMPDPAEEWLRKVQLRAFLEDLVDAACVELPDSFLAFAIARIRTEHPEVSSEPSLDLKWTSRKDVPATTEAMTAYLEDQEVTTTVASIIQDAFQVCKSSSDAFNCPEFVVAKLSARLRSTASASGA